MLSQRNGSIKGVLVRFLSLERVEDVGFGFGAAECLEEHLKLSQRHWHNYLPVIVVSLGVFSCNSAVNYNASVVRRRSDELTRRVAFTHEYAFSVVWVDHLLVGAPG